MLKEPRGKMRINFTCGWQKSSPRSMTPVCKHLRRKIKKNKMKKITLNRIFFLNVEVGIRKINAAFNKIHDKVHVRANNVTCSLRSSCYICEEIRTRVTG